MPLATSALIGVRGTVVSSLGFSERTRDENAMFCRSGKSDFSSQVKRAEVANGIPLAGGKDRTL